MHVSYSEFREHLAQYMDDVESSGDALHVTRQGNPGIVVMSESEFDAMMETLHLLRSPANALDLNTAIRDLDEGRGVRYDPKD